jgi:hypothetical protein
MASRPSGTASARACVRCPRRGSSAPKPVRYPSPGTSFRRTGPIDARSTAHRYRNRTRAVAPISSTIRPRRYWPIARGRGMVASRNRRGPFSLPDRGSVPACEPICKTRAPRVNTAAARRPASSAACRTIRPPTTASIMLAGATMPVRPALARRSSSACGCLDDFPEAVVMMQTVRLGGADLVCTGTVR